MDTIPLLRIFKRASDQSMECIWKLSQLCAFPRSEFSTELYRADVDGFVHASSMRVRQFLAGRECAHSLLEELGISAEKILRRHDGAPISSGNEAQISISHSGEVVLAAVARNENALAVGCDVIEEGSDFSGDEAPLPAWVNTRCDPHGAFAIFESVYKAYLSATLPFFPERLEWKEGPSPGRFEFLDPFLGIEGTIKSGFCGEAKAHFAVCILNEVET